MPHSIRSLCRSSSNGADRCIWTVWYNFTRRTDGHPQGASFYLVLVLCLVHKCQGIWFSLGLGRNLFSILAQSLVRPGRRHPSIALAPHRGGEREKTRPATSHVSPVPLRPPRQHQKVHLIYLGDWRPVAETEREREKGFGYIRYVPSQHARWPTTNQVTAEWAPRLSRV